MKIAVLPLASSPIKSQNRWSVEVPSDPLWHPCKAASSQATAREPAGSASAAGAPVVSRTHGRSESLGCHKP